MLLRLVPEPPHPTILFTLAFNNLPEGLPFPPAWTTQLQHILHDELEMPQCIHALDKAAWAACLLHEVTFSVAARCVSVMFIDGTSFEWPLEDDSLSSSLTEVMTDVSESSVAAEMEQRRAQAIQAAAQAQAAQERMPAAPTTPTPTPVKGKHKKSRSLLMSLVASFCPSSHSAPSPSSLIPPRPLAPLELAPPPPEPPQSSRFLRRKARAGLVDIYRRYTLPALAMEAPFLFNRSGLESGLNGGGYVLWNLQSILKRIESRMHELSTELGSTNPSRSSSVRSKLTNRRIRAAANVLAGAPFDEEEETRDSEDSAESADTEASSVGVRTPSDVLPAYPIMCGSVQEEDNARVRQEGGLVDPITNLGSPAPSPAQHCHPLPHARPRSHRPTKRQSQLPQKHVNSAHHQAQQHEYAILHASTVRLRGLINRTAQFVQTQADERNTALVQLERRSRRRAWSCKQLLGGASMDMGMKEGLAVPLRSTGLRWSWTVTSMEGDRSIENAQLHGRLQGLGRPSGPPISAQGSEDLPPPMFYVPSQANCVPFPQGSSATGEGDDFCSTGPQDTSTLFGEGDVEDVEFPPASPTGQTQEETASFARSHSSDDLPSLFSSLSTPSPTTASSSSSPSTSPSPPSDLACNFDSGAFEDAEIEVMELENLRAPEFQMDAYVDEPGCNEFRAAGPLDFEKPSVTAPIPVPASRRKFGEEMNRIGTAIGRGMGAKLYARRKTASLR